jgi:hypothetical protein
MKKNYTISETTVAFIKWRQCLILYNNNKEENQPYKCKVLWEKYDTIVENNIRNLEKQKKKKISEKQF